MKILIRDVMQEIEGIDEEIITPALSDIYTGKTIEFDLDYDFAQELGQIDCVGIGYTDAYNVQIDFSNGIDTLYRTVYITKEAPYQNGLYIFDPVKYDDLETGTLEFDGEDAILEATDTTGLEELLLDGETATLDGELWEVDGLGHTGGETWEVSYYANYTSITITLNGGTFVGRIGFGRYRKLGTNFVKEIGWYTNIESIISESGQTIPGAGGYYGRTFDADVRHKIDSDTYDDIDKAAPYIMRSYPYFLCLDDEQHKLPANMYYFYAATVEPITKLQSSTYKFLYSYKFEFQERF